MLPPLVKRSVNLTLPEIEGVITVIESAWPSGNTLAERVAYFQRQNRTRSQRSHALIKQATDQQVVATAEYFVRNMQVAGQLRPIGCLAAVCVLPTYRQQGLGKQVVEGLFAVADAGGVPVTLFQTGVPAFYTRLGARLVKNRFINSQSDAPNAYPFADPFVMIYPAGAAWPAGDVDIMGEAY